MNLRDCKCYFVCIIDNIASDHLVCVAPEPEPSPLKALAPDTSLHWEQSSLSGQLYISAWNANDKYCFYMKVTISEKFQTKGSWSLPWRFLTIQPREGGLCPGFLTFQALSSLVTQSKVMTEKPACVCECDSVSLIWLTDFVYKLLSLFSRLSVSWEKEVKLQCRSPGCSHTKYVA